MGVGLGGQRPCGEGRGLGGCACTQGTLGLSVGSQGQSDDGGTLTTATHPWRGPAFSSPHPATPTPFTQRCCGASSGWDGGRGHRWRPQRSASQACPCPPSADTCHCSPSLGRGQLGSGGRWFGEQGAAPQSCLVRCLTHSEPPERPGSGWGSGRQGTAAPALSLLFVLWPRETRHLRVLTRHTRSGKRPLIMKSFGGGSRPTWDHCRVPRVHSVPVFQTFWETAASQNLEGTWTLLVTSAPFLQGINPRVPKRARGVPEVPGGEQQSENLNLTPTSGPTQGPKTPWEPAGSRDWPCLGRLPGGQQAEGGRLGDHADPGGLARWAAVGRLAGRRRYLSL